MILQILKYAGYVVFAYAAFVGILFLAQRNMIYFAAPTKFLLKDSQVAGVKEIIVKTQDGLELTGWYAPPQNPSMPTMIRFHGNGSNVMWNMNSMRPFAEKGYGVLSAEYRGFSGNPGKPSELGLYNDARAFMEWLKSSGTPEGNIIVYGESIGAGPAVQLAIEYPAIHTLILQCPFTSLPDAASVHYPYVPVQLLLKDRYDNLGKIGKIKTPLIVMHGTIDNVIPYALGKALFDAAPEPKTMITIEGGNHNDLAIYNMNEKLISALSE